MTLFRATASGVLPDGRIWSFRMHYSSGLSVTQVENDWHTQVDIAWSTAGTPLKIFYPAGTTLTATKAEQLLVVAFAGPPAVSKLRATAVAQNLTTIAGTNANPALPDQNAILVSLRNGSPGKENRGRIHLPAPSQNLVTLGKLASTDAANVSTAINGVMTGMIASGHNPVLATYVLSKTGSPVGTIRPITVAETDEVIRTMRVRNKREKAVYA